MPRLCAYPHHSLSTPEDLTLLITNTQQGQVSQLTSKCLSSNFHAPARQAVMELACREQPPIKPVRGLACLFRADTPRPNFHLAVGICPLTCNPVFSRKGTESLLCYPSVSKLATHRTQHSSRALQLSLGSSTWHCGLHVLVDPLAHTWLTRSPHPVPSAGVCFQSWPARQSVPVAQSVPVFGGFLPFSQA